jgi:hypothetical protein
MHIIHVIFQYITGIKSKNMFVGIIEINNILKFNMLLDLFYGYFPFRLTRTKSFLLDFVSTHM